jgi:ankyrin repeat protein
MTEDFMDAAIQGDVAKVKAMLREDPSLANSKDQNGLSVILKATYYGKRDVVTELLAAGPKLNVFEAAATGQTDQVRDFIDQDPALLNMHSPDGFAPLSLAVFFGHLETVNALLAAGADVNNSSRESMKVTPLASAGAANRNDIARILVEHGADVNAKAANDFSPLHEAAATGNLELATLLLENGADINAKTTEGKTPLDYAKEHNRAELVEWLQAKSSDRP